MLWDCKALLYSKSVADFGDELFHGLSCIFSIGRPQQAWDTKLEMFCRYKTLGNWEIVARNAARWDALLPCFLDFCSM